MAARRPLDRLLPVALLLLALLGTVPYGDTAGASTRSAHRALQRLRQLLRHRVSTTGAWAFPLDEYVATRFYWPKVSEFTGLEKLGAGAFGMAFKAPVPAKLSEVLPGERKIVVKAAAAFAQHSSPSGVPLEFLYQINAFQTVSELLTESKKVPDPTSIVFPYTYFWTNTKVADIGSTETPPAQLEDYTQENFKPTFKKSEKTEASHSFGLVTELGTGGSLHDLVGSSKKGARSEGIPNHEGLTRFATALGQGDLMRALLVVAYSLVNAVATLNLNHPPIVHRDIKPDNVYLFEVMDPKGDGTRLIPKLGDLGNAVFATPAEQKRFFDPTTTPRYAPPEVYLAAFAESVPLFRDLGVGAFIPWRHEQHQHSNAFDMWQIGMTLFDILMRLPAQKGHIAELSFGFRLCYPETLADEATEEFMKMAKQRSIETQVTEDPATLREQLRQMLSDDTELANQLAKYSDEEIKALYQKEQQTDESLPEALVELLSKTVTLQDPSQVLAGHTKRTPLWHTFLEERQSVLAAFYRKPLGGTTQDVPPMERSGSVAELKSKKAVAPLERSESFGELKRKKSVSKLMVNVPQKAILDQDKIVDSLSAKKETERHGKSKISIKLFKKKTSKKSKTKGVQHDEPPRTVTFAESPQEIKKVVEHNVAEQNVVDNNPMHKMLFEFLESLVACDPMKRPVPSVAVAKVLELFQANDFPPPGSSEEFMDPGLAHYYEAMEKIDKVTEADPTLESLKKGLEGLTLDLSSSYDSSSNEESSTNEVDALKKLLNGIDFQY